MKKTTANGNTDAAALAAANIFLSIDWDLLRAQKMVMLTLQTRLDEVEYDTLEGIINLIDNIQDVAVDHFGMPPDRVYLSENHDTRWAEKVIANHSNSETDSERRRKKP